MNMMCMAQKLIRRANGVAYPTVCRHTDGTMSPGVKVTPRASGAIASRRDAHCRRLRSHGGARWRAHLAKSPPRCAVALTRGARARRRLPSYRRHCCFRSRFPHDCGSARRRGRGVAAGPLGLAGHRRALRQRLFVDQLLDERLRAVSLPVGTRVSVGLSPSTTVNLAGS